MYRESQFYLTQGLGITLQVFWRQGDNPPSVMDLQIKVTCKIAEQSYTSKNVVTVLKVLLADNFTSDTSIIFFYFSNSMYILQR
jgi:hypothetical protein